MRFAATGDCGTFTAHVDGQITGTRTVTIAGTPVPTFVVTTTLTATGQVQATISETDWFAPSIRLSVHVETAAHGTYGFASFSSHATSDLEALTPS
jgi:hypothetical protein